MTADGTLVYDVGLHKGEDTEYYLKKGYNVVAFEADPQLAAHCRTIFSEEIAQGRLTIVEGAIAPESVGDVVTFYRSSVSVWGTLNHDWLERNIGYGADFEEVRVARVDMADVFRSFGVPHYLKIDVEGSDLLVLNTLKEMEDRPAYVSLETCMDDFAEWDAQIRSLRDLGYTRFSCLEQSSIPGRSITTRDLYGREICHVFAPDSSGGFGQDLPGPWIDFEQIRREYTRKFRYFRLFGYRSPLRRIRGSYRALRMVERLIHRPIPGFSGWYDLHAAL